MILFSVIRRSFIGVLTLGIFRVETAAAFCANLQSCGERPTAELQLKRLACEAQQLKDDCARHFKWASEADRKNFLSCGNPDDLCESSGGARLLACGSGAWQGVVIDPLYGVIHLGQASWDVLHGRRDLPNMFNLCSDLDTKNILLGELRPTDLTDAVLNRMSCGDIKKFADLKTEIILKKLEERRQNLITEGGENAAGISNLKLSAAERAAVLHAAKNSGPLARARCLKREVAAREACKLLSTDVMAILGTSAALGGLARGAVTLSERLGQRAAKVAAGPTGESVGAASKMTPTSMTAARNESSPPRVDVTSPGKSEGALSATSLPPRLKALKDQVDPSRGHQVEIKDGRGIVRINFLNANSDKEFMTMLYGALREGSIAELHTGTIIGPKVLALLVRLNKMTKKSVPLKIEGKVAPDLLDAITQNKPSFIEKSSGEVILLDDKTKAVLRTEQGLSKSDLDEYSSAVERLKIKDACLDLWKSISLHNCGEIHFLFDARHPDQIQWSR